MCVKTDTSNENEIKCENEGSKKKTITCEARASMKIIEPRVKTVLAASTFIVTENPK